MSRTPYPDGVWAMRSLRSRRFAALRVEPSFGASKLRSAAAIAIFWTFLFVGVLAI